MSNIKEYEVTNPMGVTFTNGTLKLTKKQAFRRRDKIKPLGDDCYEVLSAVMFKNGERLGYDGLVSKALLSEVGEVIKKDTEDTGAGNTQGTTDGSPPEGEKTVDLDKMTKKELMAELDGRKIEYRFSETKEEMIQKVIDYENAQGAGTED